LKKKIKEKDEDENKDEDGVNSVRPWLN